MSKALKVGLGTLIGGGLGMAAGNVASLAMNRALVKKISMLDEELDNSLSKLQLEMKSKIEKRAIDLDYHRKGTKDFILLEIEINKMKKNLVDTLLPKQLIIYKKIEASLSEYQKRTNTTSIITTLLGGLAGGILVSKLN